MSKYEKKKFLQNPLKPLGTNFVKKIWHKTPIYHSIALDTTNKTCNDTYASMSIFNFIRTIN